MTENSHEFQLEELVQTWDLLDDDANAMYATNTGKTRPEASLARYETPKLLML
jgi:hypothetical protein